MQNKSQWYLILMKSSDHSQSRNQPGVVCRLAFALCKTRIQCSLKKVVEQKQSVLNAVLLGPKDLPWNQDDPRVLD